MNADDKRDAHVTLVVSPPNAVQKLRPPCADEDGRIPAHCPGWCEFASPDLRAMYGVVPEGAPIPEPGVVIPEGIRLEGRLGAGGMGTVFRAYDQLLHRAAAVKFVAEEDLDDPSLRGRFVSEARSLARVQSENVVRIFGFGQWHGRPYIVMEYISGVPLDDMLIERDGKIAFPQAMEVIHGVANGLAAIHEAGALHNDIKPANVIIAARDRVVIVDLGLARPYDRSCRLDQDFVTGTPSYMAPELSTGQATSPSPVTDVYALGVLAYELLTGSVPYPGEDQISIVRLQLRTVAPPVSVVCPDAPRELSRLIERATHRDPLRRPANARAFLEEMAPLM